MKNTPETTLFMLMSLDGKISTGFGDERDFDRDLPKITGANGGLSQYYRLEQETDRFSFNTGKVMAKVGWNDAKSSIEKLPVTFIIVDNKPHLTIRGVTNLIARSQKLYIITTNDQHPAIKVPDNRLDVIKFIGSIDFQQLFRDLRSRGIDRLTVQSGGEMNANLLREGLIDYVSVVVAPILVGGRDTPTLIDGDSLEDIQKVRPLQLLDTRELKHSYLYVKYKVSH